MRPGSELGGGVPLCLAARPRPGELAPGALAVRAAPAAAGDPHGWSPPFTQGCILALPLLTGTGLTCGRGRQGRDCRKGQGRRQQPAAACPHPRSDPCPAADGACGVRRGSQGPRRATHKHVFLPLTTGGREKGSRESPALLVFGDVFCWSRCAGGWCQGWQCRAFCGEPQPLKVAPPSLCRGCRAGQREE